METESLPLKKGDIFEDPFESEKNPPFTPALPLDYEESQEKKEESEDELIEIQEEEEEEEEESPKKKLKMVEPNDDEDFEPVQISKEPYHLS